MKKILTAAIALSLLGGSVAAAQPYDHRNDRQNSGYDNRSNGQDSPRAHRWARGERLPPAYRTPGHYVDYRRNHLRPPPRGYRWVQVDNNYALVALTSGLISQMIAAR